MDYPEIRELLRIGIIVFACGGIGMTGLWVMARRIPTTRTILLVGAVVCFAVVAYLRYCLAGNMGSWAWS